MTADFEEATDYIIEEMKGFVMEKATMSVQELLAQMGVSVLFFVFRTVCNEKNASGGVQSFIALKVFRNYLFSLPPYEEQKRIVIGLKNAMSYCQKFDKKEGAKND